LLFYFYPINLIIGIHAGHEYEWVEREGYYLFIPKSGVIFILHFRYAAFIHPMSADVLHTRSADILYHRFTGFLHPRAADVLHPRSADV
jgi:hypothetical protein